LKRFKGPQWKLTDLKVPTVLADLYLDLRDRRLLPLIGLVLVAIVAVPFLLGRGGETAEPAPAPIGSAPGGEASLTVLPAEPGLREPSKRLAGLPSKDPFRQHYTAPVFNKGAVPTSEVSTSTGTTTSSTESGSEVGPSEGGSSLPAPGPAPETPGASAGSGSPQPGEVQLYSFAINVKIARTEATDSGALKMGEPVVREDVGRGTALPGAKAPVLTYMGVDDEFKKALMLVSTEATGLLGDNKCLAGTSTCQLLALEPGLPEIVEYGENGARYRFELLSIDPVKGPKIKEPQGSEAKKRKR
jgi:hypothetical protein